MWPCTFVAYPSRVYHNFNIDVQGSIHKNICYPAASKAVILIGMTRTFGFICYNRKGCRLFLDNVKEESHKLSIKIYSKRCCCCWCCCCCCCCCFVVVNVDVNDVDVDVYVDAVVNYLVASRT